MENDYTVWREAEWVGVILQQFGGGNTKLARLVPAGTCNSNLENTAKVTENQIEAS